MTFHELLSQVARSFWAAVSRVQGFIEVKLSKVAQISFVFEMPGVKRAEPAQLRAVNDLDTTDVVQFHLFLLQRLPITVAGLCLRQFLNFRQYDLHGSSRRIVLKDLSAELFWINRKLHRDPFVRSSGLLGRALWLESYFSRFAQVLKRRLGIEIPT